MAKLQGFRVNYSLAVCLLLPISLASPIPNSTDALTFGIPPVINQTVLRDNVPNDFQFSVEPVPDASIFAPILWLALFRCMALAAELPFDVVADSFPCLTGSLEIKIAPYPVVSHQPFRLLNNHIVWAIQRLSEDIYHNNHYSELDANIECYGTSLGKLTLRADRTNYVSAKSGNTNGTTLQSTELLNILNGTTDVMAASNVTVGATQVAVSIRPLATPPVPISRIKSYLLMIRAMARLAVHDWLAISDNSWLFDDFELGLGINYGKNVVTEDVIMWRSLVLSLLSFFDRWQTDSRSGAFYEAEGLFFTPGVDQLLGRIQITKLGPRADAQAVVAS